MPKKLHDKVAIVTGASKGIGASIALHMAEEGAAVVVNYATSKEGADRVVNEIIKKGGKAFAVQANMSSHDDIKHLFNETIKQFGKVDILVNNAGIYEFTPLDKLTAEQFHKIFNINVLGLMLATKEAAKHFGDKGGSIVNISSVASTGSIAQMSVYSATKAAVDSLTRTLSTELGPRKIRINSINPGLIETEGVHAMGIMESDLKKHVEQETPLGRIGQPHDIAPAVVFLASDDAGWITGETLYIAGGPRP